MATEEGYNGWTNKPTWLVQPWIDNEQESQEYWLDQARAALNDPAEPHMRLRRLADQLQEGFEEAANLEETTSGFFTDLFGWALTQVEWLEIAQSLIEDAKEVPA